MANMFKKFLGNLKLIFRKNKEFSLGLYGAPNSGKTTLANKILADILGEEAPQFTTSNIEHETREVEEVKNLKWEKTGKRINFDLIDTPGIATKIDFEDFVKKGMKKKAAKDRAKEATKGVIESIKWMDNVDCVLIVIDSSKNPYNQVNITTVANFVAKKKKMIIVANKCDLKTSKVDKIKLVFPEYKVVKVSALKGEGIEKLYNTIIKEVY
jgi:GTPase